MGLWSLLEPHVLWSQSCAFAAIPGARTASPSGKKSLKSGSCDACGRNGLPRGQIPFLNRICDPPELRLTPSGPDVALFCPKVSSSSKGADACLSLHLFIGK